jgi:hypothetical protein
MDISEIRFWAAKIRLRIQRQSIEEKIILGASWFFAFSHSLGHSGRL